MRFSTVATLVAALVAATALIGSGAAQATYVAPFVGNDTGGIISYSLVGKGDVSLMAADHCAKYGKVARLTGVQAHPGGYLSFACVWAYPEDLARRAAALRVRG